MVKLRHYLLKTRNARFNLMCNILATVCLVFGLRCHFLCDKYLTHRLNQTKKLKHKQAEARLCMWHTCREERKKNKKNKKE